MFILVNACIYIPVCIALYLDCIVIVIAIVIVNGDRGVRWCNSQ